MHTFAHTRTHAHNQQPIQFIPKPAKKKKEDKIHTHARHCAHCCARPWNMILMLILFLVGFPLSYNSFWHKWEKPYCSVLYARQSVVWFMVMHGSFYRANPIGMHFTIRKTFGTIVICFRLHARQAVNQIANVYRFADDLVNYRMVRVLNAPHSFGSKMQCKLRYWFTKWLKID